MSTVCLYFTHPRNPQTRFEPERKLKHLERLGLKPDDKDVHCYVVAADFRRQGLETFRKAIADMIGKDGILSIEYQLSLTFRHKTVAQSILYKLLNHHRVYVIK